MLLGDLLAAARHSAGAFQAFLEAEDPALAQAIVEASAREGMSPAGYVRLAVADFDRFALPEDWQALTSHLRNNPDPGMVCLLDMVRWRLALELSSPAGPAPFRRPDNTPEKVS